MCNERIREIQFQLSSQRASGRSSRILNDIIERFFQEPMGTKIKIIDHFLGSRNGIETMKSNIKKRLDNEYKGYEYSIEDDCLIRKTKTSRELLYEELNRLQGLDDKQ